MAITVDSLLMDISVDAKSANKSLEEVIKRLESVDKSLKSVDSTSEKTEKSIGSFGVQMAVLNQALELAQKAFRAIVGPLQTAVKMFIELDSAQSKLINTLKLTGGASDAATKDLLAFASQMEMTSRVSEESALDLLSIAKATGLTNEQAKIMVKTAANLAAVTGQDVNTAFREMLGQLSGAPGRLSKMIPALKDLTEEELKAGKGIEIISQKVAGFASADIATLSGALHQADNAFENFSKAVGGVVVDLINLPEILKIIKDVFEDLQFALEATKRALEKLDWESVGKTVGIAAAAFGALFLVLNAPAIAAITASFIAMAIPLALVAAKFIIITGAIAGVIVAVDLIVRNFDRLPDLAAIAVNGIILGLRKLWEFIEDLANLIVDQLKSAWEFVANLFSPTNIKAILTGTASIGDIIGKAFSDAFDSAIAGVSKSNEELITEIKEKSKGLDLGIAGQGMSAITSMMKEFGGHSDDAAESITAIGTEFGKVVETSKEQFETLEKLRLENEVSANNIKNINADAYEIATNEMILQLKKIAALREELRLKGLLTGETEGELKEAEGLAREKLKETVDKEFQVKMSQYGAISSTLGKTTKFAAESIIGLDQKTSIKAGEWAAEISDGIAVGADYFIKGLKIVANLWLALFDPKTYSDLADKINNFLTKLPNALGSAMDGLLNALDNLLENGPAILDNLISKVEVFITKFMKKLPEIIEQMLAGAQRMLDSMLEMLPGIIGGIMDQLPKIIDGMFDGLVKIFDALPGIFDKIFEALPGIVAKIFDRLPDLITSILNAIPKIVSGILNALPDIVSNIITALPDIIEALISGIIGASAEITIALIEMIINKSGPFTIAITKALTKGLTLGIIKGIVDGLKRGIKALKGFKIDGFEKQVKDLGKTLEDGGKKFAKAFTKESSQLFKLADFGEGAGKVTDPIKAQADAFMENINEAGRKIAGLWETIKNGWNKLMEDLKKAWAWVKEKILDPMFNAIKAAWMWVYETLLKPVLDAMKTVWLVIYESVIKPMIDGLTAVWRWIYDTVIGPMIDGLTAVWQIVYDNVVRPLVDGLQAVWTFVVDKVLGPIGDVFKTAWDGIMDFFKNIFKGKISEAFEGVFTTFSTVGTKIWDGLKGGIAGAGTLFKDLGSGIWDGLKEGIGKLGELMKAELAKIDPSNLFKKMFSFDGGGIGKVEKALGIDVPFANFALGGYVPGQAQIPGDSLTNDRVVAMVSPGEAIIPRSIAQTPLAQEVISALLSGKIEELLAFFGHGGVKIPAPKVPSVGDVTGAVKDLGGQLAEGGKSAFETVANVGQDVLDSIAQIDPTKLWDLVKEKVWDAVWAMVTNSATNFHRGGLVPGYAFGGDVPTFLQPGEFVMQRSAVDNAGLGFMNAVNQGNMSGKTVNQTFNFDVSVKVDASSQSLDEGYVRNRLVPTLKAELKRASYNGELLISSRGIDK